MKLTDAAKQGRFKIVIDAVESGEATNFGVLLEKVCQDYHSIKKHDGHIELTRFLLSAGAKPEKEMVCEAARGGHEALVHALVEGGLSRDLFVASALGDAEDLKDHLSESKMIVAATDSQGMTPLHYCCASKIWQSRGGGRDEFLKASSILLSAEANVHALGEYHGLTGITPLFYVAWTGGHHNIAKQLLERGAEISHNIFFAAVGHFQRHGDGNYEVAKVLLEHGYDVNHCDGRTALHAFASHEDLRGVSWLLENGADVNARDLEDNTPLMAAARRNSGTKVLRLLVEAGSSLSDKNCHGQTALVLAELNGKAKAAAYLSSLSG